MRTENKWWIVKIGMITIMLALLLAYRVDEATISVVVSIVVVLVLLNIFRIKHPEHYRQDEMTRYLGSKAAAWSWVITMIVVTMLYWIDYVGAAELSAKQMIGIIMATMIVTIVAFRAYMFRKGDAK